MSDVLSKAYMDVQDSLDVCVSVTVAGVGTTQLRGGTLRNFIVADSNLLKDLAQSTRSVLDLSAGVGMRLAIMGEANPKLQLAGVESYGPARKVAAEKMPGATFYESIESIPADAEFEMILVMSQSFGLMGTEAKARELLKKLVQLLAQWGQLVIEVGNPLSGLPYQSNKITVGYGDDKEEIECGWYGRDWMMTELRACGLEVKESKYFTTFTRYYRAIMPVIQD